MREIYARIAKRLDRGERFAVATLVEMRDAAPAPLGTSLLVDIDGSFCGNIGAGCHEGELVDAALAVLRGGESTSIGFNLTDELLDGSACGASLRVVVWIPSPAFAAIASQIADGREDVIFACGGYPVAIGKKRTLIIVGATELASHLSRTAREADFHVTVVDPRPRFATEARLPHADRLVVAWPQDALPPMLACDAIVVLAHDAKIDLPALRCALDSDIAYVGALGSRRSQNARREALAALGFGGAALARIHGPVGLDIGGVTNAQIACSIVAEILSVLNARCPMPLSIAEA